MKYKVLIIGKGYIGQRLSQEFGWEISDKRINSLSDAEALIKEHAPDIIINCIGYIGKRHVDDCEIDKDKTLVANTFVPIILAEAAVRNKIKLVHISSGCIYDFDYSKQKPITEEDIPDFFGLYYSRTKIYAERVLETLAWRHDILILRIRIPLDNRPSPRNILDKLIKYGKVIDLPNSITYIPDFILMLKHLIKINATGIYNTVNKYGLRYPELMDIYKKYVPGFKYEIIDYAQLGLIRTNLVMSVKKLEKTGFTVRDIHDVLEECVAAYVEGGG
ncbi:MAG: sugar nucleotide-binding protein [Candidatus Omnitrophica bacterium]|nr:sugar nucleotide-binding protein [Candidatus Omnitrophota bacterium]